MTYEIENVGTSMRRHIDSFLEEQDGVLIGLKEVGNSFEPRVEIEYVMPRSSDQSVRKQTMVFTKKYEPVCSFPSKDFEI